MVALRSTSLGELPEGVARPTYDRRAVQVGIVHLGLGAFARAHLAMYVDRLLGAEGARDWGICGVGILAGDRLVQDALRAQDGLYTLVLRHPDGTLEPRVIGSVVDYRFAPDDPEAVVAQMASATTRIVSLTITEGGYNLSDVDGTFDATAPHVVADLADGAAPRTVFGLVVEALARRRARGIPPFAVMSCDNLQENGALARRSFASFARLRDPELGAWVERAVAFPSSMVDRITPATTDEERRMVRERVGVEDACPVVAEPFAQWVLEDAFPLGRPPLERAGVQLVADVEPYERMKLRLLNASHQALAYFGWLLGHRYVHEAAADPDLAAFLLGYMEREAAPTIPPLVGIDLPSYARSLLARFGNEHVRDSLARICAETSDRIPKFLLPVIRDQLETGGEIARGAAVVASWARYAEGTDEQGREIVVVDRARDRVMANARRQRVDPLAFVADRTLFGDLADRPRFVAAYRDALRSLHERGARATLASLR